jgi:glycosyltransferase involved in cell wall biosynthesis
VSNFVRVIFLGLRGFPGVQGGVETHAEHLCPLLADLGCEVTAIVRSPYMPPEKGASWHGVRFVRVWSPKSKGMEAIIHTFLGVLVAAWQRPDVLHIQAIGPALMTPLARLLGLKVVVTHHGPDYDRQKWGRFARLVLRLGERWGMRLANERIVISEVIREITQAKHGRTSVLIPNGVKLPELAVSDNIIRQFGLEPGKYVLLVSRLVPEKRHLDLVEAFRNANIPGWKLVLVGAADHPDAYTQRVLETARGGQDIVCTGYQTGVALSELYSHSGLFVLPSSHEGLPIAMLEALSYGRPVVASDIPANLEVGLPAECYFKLGDVSELAQKLCEFSARSLTAKQVEQRRMWVVERYDWRHIGERTLAVYREVCGIGSGPGC